MSAAGHVPVMLAEAIDALAPRADAVYLDATFGGGGYARALLEAAPCRVWAIDRDPDAVARGRVLERAFPGRLTVIEGRFGVMDRLLGAVGVAAVDGIALDLGVSSFQLDDPTRGFSFQGDGPLDLRMGRAGPSAADLVNGEPEERLADILRAYGEERRAGAVARAIVRARATQPIERTLQLADIVRSVVRRAADGLDPATRTFQALRIVVNDELGELEQALGAAERILVAGGRLVVVAFHSLEDGMVKRFLVERGGRHVGASRHAPPAPVAHPATFLALTRKPARPGDLELAANPRARSARLRIAERTAAPAWEAAA